MPRTWLADLHDLRAQAGVGGPWTKPFRGVRPRQVVGTVVGLVLLAGAVSGCEELESAPPQSSVTDASTPAVGEQEPTPAAAQTPDAAEAPADTDTSEGEDPATMEDDVPDVDLDAVVVDYETPPGDCHNDVPLPQTKHGVVSTENIAGGECLITIDSQGDSLFMVNDIAAQLTEADFQEVGENEIWINNFSSATHKVMITVSDMTSDEEGVLTVGYLVQDAAAE